MPYFFPPAGALVRPPPDGLPVVLGQPPPPLPPLEPPLVEPPPPLLPPPDELPPDELPPLPPLAAAAMLFEVITNAFIYTSCADETGTPGLTPRLR